MNEKSITFLDRGGVWVMIQFLLMALVIVLGVAFHGDWTRLPLILTGAALFIAGGYAGVAGVVALGRSRTPYPRPLEGAELADRGVYARIRHPLYTSVMLASVGWAFIWQSRPSLITALILVPFFFAKALREERWLRERYPGYADYARRVPRFIPRLGSGSRTHL